MSISRAQAWPSRAGAAHVCIERHGEHLRGEEVVAPPLLHLPAPAAAPVVRARRMMDAVGPAHVRAPRPADPAPTPRVPCPVPPGRPRSRRGCPRSRGCAACPSPAPPAAMARVAARAALSVAFQPSLARKEACQRARCALRVCLGRRRRAGRGSPAARGTAATACHVAHPGREAAPASNPRGSMLADSAPCPNRRRTTALPSFPAVAGGRWLSAQRARARQAAGRVGRAGGQQ